MAMAAARSSRLAMDRAYVTKPSGVMSTIFVSTASTASRMLVAAAETSMAAGGGDGWRPVEHVRQLMMLGIWVHVWGLRLFMDLFPPPALSFSSFINGLGGGAAGSSSALVVHGGTRSAARQSSSTTGIGRALSHILGILNEIPATSRKYEYVLAMADRILNDNVKLGHAALLDVNRAVLGSAFARTCDILRRALHRSECAASALAWPARVLRRLPLGPRLAACYDGLRLRISTLLPTAADAWRACSKFQHQLAVPEPSSSVHEWLEAEKLAHELLWITNKLRACSASSEAIVRWAAASSLASLALTAHPRVQGPLIKITAMLYREMGSKGEWETPRRVRFGILALWLPLLCYSGNGVTTPVLVGMERWETERVMEDLIAGLPLEDQGVLLRNWLEDFAASDSDWPNLQSCFDRWCWHSRKLLI